MRILVDGDCIVYRAAWAAQKTKYRVWLGPDLVEEYDYKKEMLAEYPNIPVLPFDEKERGIEDWKRGYTTFEILEPVENVLSTVKAMLNGIRDQFGRDDLEIFIGGDGNFRNEIATLKPYKGTRGDKPKHYAAVREYLVSKHGATVTSGEEADDAMSIAQCVEYDAQRKSVIVTIDKDLNMVPGLHYNFVTKEQFHIEPPAAMDFFFHQLITGDSTDNIAGIVGAGPKKAASLLDGLPHKEMFVVIQEEYAKEYGVGWEIILLEMGRLLWMRRVPDEMWEFPQYG